MKLVGFKAQDKDGKDICLSCYLDAFFPKGDNTMTCPDCYGIGFKSNLFGAVKRCETCLGLGKIQTADLGLISKELENIVNYEDIPF